MRRLVVSLTVAALALAVAGCTSGTADTATTTVKTVGSTPAASTASVTSVITGTGATFVPFPTGDFVPADLKKLVDAKHPVLIYFYNSKQYISTENRAIIDSILAKNVGLMDLVAYDLSRYATVNGAGIVSIDPAYAKDATAVQVVGLARALNAGSTPYIVLVDKQGYVTYTQSGLSDRTFLQREIFRAAR